MTKQGIKINARRQNIMIDKIVQIDKKPTENANNNIIENKYPPFIISEPITFEGSILFKAPLSCINPIKSRSISKNKFQLIPDPLSNPENKQHKIFKEIDTSPPHHKIFNNEKQIPFQVQQKLPTIDEIEHNRRFQQSTFLSNSVLSPSNNPKSQKGHIPPYNYSQSQQNLGNKNAGLSTLSKSCLPHKKSSPRIAASPLLFMKPSRLSDFEQYSDLMNHQEKEYMVELIDQRNQILDQMYEEDTKIEELESGSSYGEIREVSYPK